MREFRASGLMRGSRRRLPPTPLLYRLRGAPFQWQLFLTTFYRVNWNWLALSILLMLLTYVGRALRWEVAKVPKPLSSPVAPPSDGGAWPSAGDGDVPRGPLVLFTDCRGLEI